MGGVSRVTKFVREALQDDSLADADQRRELPISIVVGDMDGAKAGVMVLTAVELSLRCFTGEVRLHIPRSLKGVLDDCVLAAERYGQSERIQLVDGIPNPSEPLLGLGVEVENGVYADAEGWVTGVNAILGPGPAVSPAIVFAVSSAFAKVFDRWILGRDQYTNESWTFSLLDFSADLEQGVSVPAEIHLGKIGLIGAGAIGTGFSFTLSHSGWSADIDIMDDDTYDEPNLETSLMITRKDALQGKQKAHRLAQLLGDVPGIITHPIKTRISETSNELLIERDILLCAVDNAETRRYLDMSGAKVVYNAGVGGSTLDAGHVLCSRHGERDLPLSRMYPDRGTQEVSKLMSFPEEIKDECSRIDYEGSSLAAPFVGLTAGALLAASCAHRALGLSVPVNYLKLDLLALQHKYQSTISGMSVGEH